LAEVAPERAGALVAVSGVITRSFGPEPGSRAPHRLVIEADGTALNIVFWQSVADSLAPAVRRVGNGIQATGILEYYNDQPQVRLKQARSVTVTSWAAAEQETP
ncbi:MAG: hypothetical protein K9N49_10000, partial [Candidatus Marinimicrobia bacterium]|nr:hypothetical protein [Candidatus Neomarinimicrobiota bacterium]